MNGCRTYAHGHHYDPISGWCLNGCGHRDDGRISINGNDTYPGPEYTPEQIHAFLTKDRT